MELADTDQPSFVPFDIRRSYSQIGRTCGQAFRLILSLTLESISVGYHGKAGDRGSVTGLSDGSPFRLLGL